MKFYQTICLKDGTECVLRNPNSSDAASILQHLIQTSGETEYMARYPDEIHMTEAEEAAYLREVEASSNAIMIAAVIDGTIVANAGFNPVAPFEKYRHRAEFGISIKKDYWGLGIGSVLLNACLEAARLAGYRQMELEVVADNERAIALYQKFGFQTYGIREHSFLCRDGHFETEYLMLCNL